MKKIIFMPFINDADGKDWRKRLENIFITGEGASLTADINSIRAAKNSYKAANNLKDYYAALHDKKGPRQEMWIKKLLSETAEVFDNKLKTLYGDDIDSEKTTIVCALPEFYWCDINDNNKHTADILGYHKPLYLANAVDILTEQNELMALTQKYKNMIFFAGTAVWKQINPDDNNDEEIFNSLIIYADGKYQESITKHHVSTIDGFYGPHFAIVDKTKKIGRAVSAFPPVTMFNGMKFTYDICLDFDCGKTGANGADKVPLSTELCDKANINDIDVNVLIAAGKSLNFGQTINIKQNIKSNILLRCDGAATPYGEIFTKAGFSSDKEIMAVNLPKLQP